MGSVTSQAGRQRLLQRTERGEIGIEAGMAEAAQGVRMQLRPLRQLVLGQSGGFPAVDHLFKEVVDRDGHAGLVHDTLCDLGLGHPTGFGGLQDL